LRATIDSENRIRRFALAGLMAGFACGCKLTAVPEILVGIAAISAVVAVAMRILQKEQNPIPWRGLALFAFCGLLTFLPWLARNAVWARNPVFPEAAGLLGHGGFSDAQVERWRRAHSPQPAQQSARARAAAFGEQVLGDWQFGYEFLPMVLIASALTIRRPQTWFLAGLLLLLLIVWLGFTHLQGRFFILALPIGALLLVEVQWRGVRASSGAMIAIGLPVAVQAIVGAANLYAELLPHLYGNIPIVALLGDEDMSWARPAALDSIPSSSPIILVGDAKAFWFYQIPMSRLRYKTVFDVDAPPGANLIDAWAGQPSTRNGGWLVIDPAELNRMVRTYQPLPPVPREIAGKDGVFTVPP
jgi:hypothetical protein